MSDFDLIIVGDVVTAECVLQKGFVGVQGEHIAHIGVGSPPSARHTIDASNCWIIPGVVDGQVHTGSQAGQEGLQIGSRAAARGGITTMVEMPYDDPEVVTTVPRFEKKRTAIEAESHVDVALYATIPPTGELGAVPGLIDSGACAFKFSMFEANPIRFPRIADGDLYEAFRLLASSGLACGVHNQDQELTRSNIAQLIARGDTGWDAFGRANSPLVEDLATARIYEMGAQTGARAHAVHVSTARGFDLCRMYRRAGVKASVETCVQYLLLNEEHMRRFGARAKHYPPLRPKAEADKLWTYIANEECDFVSSDHVAWSLDRKASANIFENQSGGPGLETLLPAFWTGCEERGLSPTIAVRQLSRNPAMHFLLRSKGDIKESLDADLVILERGKFLYDPSHSLSAVKWSSFDGCEFSVRVVSTFVRGQLVWDGSNIINKPGFGKFQRPAHTSIVSGETKPCEFHEESSKIGRRD
jgi:allantoinase